jgi:biotin synthase-related radical SAM superfamily protein
VAFGGNGQVTITDFDGQERFQIVKPHMDWCTEIAWNPAADLSRLDERPAPPAQD